MGQKIEKKTEKQINIDANSLKNSNNNVIKIKENNKNTDNHSNSLKEIQNHEKRIINLAEFKEFFLKSQENGFLTKDKFNEALTPISRFNIPLIKYTYLSERLFELIDDKNCGKILENDFVLGMRNVFSSKDSMIHPIKKSSKSLIFNDLCAFFVNSYLFGFNALVINILNNSKDEFNKLNIFIPSKSQIEYFVFQNEINIKTYLIDSLKENDIDPTSIIEFDEFRKWIILDHTIQISYASKDINIATSLVCLDGIEIEENTNINIIYPKFK